jgi:hypothetical protein
VEAVVDLFPILGFLAALTLPGSDSDRACIAQRGSRGSYIIPRRGTRAQVERWFDHLRAQVPCRDGLAEWPARLLCENLSDVVRQFFHNGFAQH